MNENQPTEPMTGAQPVINDDAISRRAYGLWEEEGRPEGRDLEHWLRAEGEFRGQTLPADGPSTTARSAASEPGMMRDDTNPLAGTRASQAATRSTREEDRAGNTGRPDEPSRPKPGKSGRNARSPRK